MPTFRNGQIDRQVYNTRLVSATSSLISCKMSLDEIQACLKAGEGVHFEGGKKEGVYAGVGPRLGERSWDELGAYGARFGAAAYREDDGAEPGADHACDHQRLRSTTPV